MRYKVGDKVKIISDSTRPMLDVKREYLGEVMTIVLADKIGKMYRMAEDNRLSPWFDSDIAGLIPENTEEFDPPQSFRPDYYGGADNPHETRKFINAHNLNFNLGNVVKYVVRAGKKDDNTVVQDLRKAIQYIEFELERISDDK